MIMHLGVYQVFLRHPNSVAVNDAIGILQLIFPALGRIVALCGNVHHDDEETVGVLHPHLVGDFETGGMLFARVLANAML